MEKLSFNKRTQSDIDLESCRKHSDLTSLNLSGSMVLGYGFEYLLDNKKLRAIYLDNTPVKAQYLKILAALPELELVDISNTGIDDSGLIALAAINNLKVLVADRLLSVTDAGLKAFPQSPSALIMQRLSLAGTAIGDKGAELISHLLSLTYLSMAGSYVTTGGASYFDSLKRLEQLNLASTRVGDPAMSALASLPLLKILDLSGTPVSPEGLNVLAGAASLCQLAVSLAYGDAIVEAVSSYKKLETLRLFDGRIDRGVGALQKMKGLKSLELTFVNLSSHAVADLKMLTNLELLVMDQDHSPLAQEMHRALPGCMIRFEN